MKRWLWQTVIAVDQLLNAFLGGWADETLSARSWRKSQDSKAWACARIVIDWIFFFDPNHCESSYRSERERRHLPAEYRDE